MPRGSAPQGSPNVQTGARAGAFEEAAPIVARDVNEPLRAHQRGAQPLDHREQRLGAAAAPDRRRSRRPAGRACARGDRRAPRAARRARRAARARAPPSPRRPPGSWRVRRPDCAARAPGAAPRPRRRVARSSLVSRIRSAASTCARASSCRVSWPPPASASTTQMTPAATAGAASPSSSSPDRIDHGSAIPVVSSSTTSGRDRRFTSSIAAHSSDWTRTSWQTQPPASSMTSPARLLMRRVSMSMRPSSLMITPTRRCSSRPRTRFSVVVLPAPRKPVSSTSGGLRIGLGLVSLHVGLHFTSSIFVGVIGPRAWLGGQRRRHGSGKAAGTQARTAATISGVVRSRSTAHGRAASVSTARCA